MRVKNLNGTTGNVCTCGSWLKHWGNFSSQTANYCMVNGCSQKPEVGGHVQRDDSSDKSWYVVPLCKTCNGKRGQDLDIFDGVVLVKANVAETCAKKS